METQKAILEKLVQEIERAEHLLDEDGHMKTCYCHWWLNSRTQRIAEISNGFGLYGTQGFEQRGCYDCYPQQPKCDIHAGWNSGE